jgi:secondary thiamine-phosphate synthase enzyme
MEQFAVATRERVQFVRIDDRVAQAVSQSGVVSGLAVVFVPHTTAAVTINENADPDVVRDMIMELDKIVPMTDHYRHAEGNSDAHIKSSLFSPSLTILIEKGRLLLGTWQSIYLCEFDGPRQRRVYVKIMPEL